MKDYRKKICTLGRALEERLRVKDAGKRIVFTNGCFDLLHPGHTRYLSEARGLGDFLMVAVNSDRSVRALKGPSRPLLGESIRAEMVAALGSVDGVLVFDEDTPFEVISRLVPDILVKGGDWAEEKIVGARLVKDAGGEVRTIPFVPGYSTTGLLRRIKEE